MDLNTMTSLACLLGSGGIIGIVIACVKGFTYVANNIVNPIRATVRQLQEVTRELRMWMEESKAELREQDKRLALVEAAIKRQNERIVSLEKRWRLQ